MAQLASIIIPCFNAERWVGEAIQSCLDQTCSPVEVIVIDDGSTDGSLEIIKSFGDKIRWETGPNRGGCAARNRGFQLSRGEFIKFLDADDLLDRDVVEIQVRIATSRPGSVPYGPWMFLEVAGGQKTVVDSHLQINFAEDILTQWLVGRFCAPHSLLWPRNTLMTVGPWDESLSSNQDGDLFLRAILAGVKFAYVAEGMVFYRKVVDGSHASVSNQRSLDVFRSRKRVLDKLYAALKNRPELERYETALGEYYCSLGLGYYRVESPELDDCLVRGQALKGGKIPGGAWHRLGVWLMGKRKAESGKRKAEI